MCDYGILENYKDFGAGIVEFALDDYVSTVKSLCTYYNKLERVQNGEKPVKYHQREGDICRNIYERIRNLDEIDGFLHSEWVQQLTTLDVEYLFKHTKQKLKEKGYRVSLMGLLVTSDDKGVKVYSNEKEGPNGKFTTYSIGVNSKSANGEWTNGYISCRFKKGVTVANKAKIKIKSAFFVASKGSAGKAYTHLMITDFEILEAGESSGTAGDSADDFMKIPEGIDDESPFL